MRPKTNSKHCIFTRIRLGEGYTTYLTDGPLNSDIIVDSMCYIVDFSLCYE